MKRFPGARMYAARAAAMLMDNIYRKASVEGALRKTLAFWCYYDGIDLPKNPPRPS